MFNIRAHSLNRFTTKARDENDDPGMTSFIESCLASFEKTIHPSVAHYADLPTKHTGVYFASEDTPSSSSSSSSDEDETSIMVIPKNVLSILEGKPCGGLHFAFLMTHPLYGKKTSANVAYSTNPMRDVYLHNILAMGDRTTSAAAPHWILDMVLGPFITADMAIECTEEWVSHTRGKDSKRKKATFLSRIYNVPLYSASIKPDIPPRQYVRNNAPPSYLARYDKLLQSNTANSSLPALRKSKKKKHKHSVHSRFWMPLKKKKKMCWAIFINTGKALWVVLVDC